MRALVSCSLYWMLCNTALNLTEALVGATFRLVAPLPSTLTTRMELPVVNSGKQDN